MREKEACFWKNMALVIYVGYLQLEFFLGFGYIDPRSIYSYQSRRIDETLCFAELLLEFMCEVLGVI